jgi:glutamine amidotransferase
MSNKVITIIDYGMGNIWSVKNAFNFLGCRTQVTNDPNLIIKADTLVLPGVGSYKNAMINLQEKNINQALTEAALDRGINILGICLGMQLMGNSSTEDGITKGLGFIPNSVEIFREEETAGNKIPHIGFNEIKISHDFKLFKNFPEKADFYFVHSYRMLKENIITNFSTCDYGVKFLAAFSVNNIYATQFHPEKSQSNGLKMLKNFIEL